MSEPGCVVDRTILDALRDGQPDLEERGILVVPNLRATYDLGGADPPLLKAIYTLYRAIPRRLAEGSTLHVWSVDRAGGDIEVGWEAREPLGGEPDATPRDALTSGPLGDLLNLAIAGLEQICRARLAQRSEPERDASAGLSALQLVPRVKRRFTILLPSIDKRVQFRK